MRATMMDYPLTVVQLFERAQRYFPHTEVVSRMPDKSLHRETFGQFYHRTRSLGAALARAGLKKGDRVATLMWNHYAHLEAYFGVPVSGGVLHTLNLRLHPDDIAYTINDAADRFLIVDDLLVPLYEQLRGKANFERVIVARLSGKALPAGCEDYEAFLAGGDAGFDYPAIDERDPLGICYTSGTTGRPRGVVYSHRSTVLHALSSMLPDAYGISRRDSICMVAPMFHINGWGLAFMAAAVGAKLVFPGPALDAESLLGLFETEQVTFAGAVTTVWLGVLQLLEREPGRWRLAPGLRLLIGGTAAPESLIRAFDRFGVTVLHAWGMTETSPLATISAPGPHLAALDEQQRYAVRAKHGLAMPLVDLRVVAEGVEVPRDGKTMGELQVRGPYITGAYHNLAHDPEKFTEDGWLRTGDVAVIDATGYIKLTDRIKDLIKSGGEWISSVDLENLIMAHPAVAEAAVIAVAHPKWGERPLAVVVLKPGQSASAEELQKFLEPKVAKWWLPDRYVFADSIPRTSTGKFLKSRLRELYAGRPAEPASGRP
jgi:fatty-acyl-CoA synthase